MKRFCPFICLAAVLSFMLFFPSSVSAEGNLPVENSQLMPSKELPAVFQLPSSLQSIEEEAFEGTAAAQVVLFDHVRRIQSRAFADMPYLEAVFIPESVLWLGDGVFSGAQSLTIYGVPGSFAETYARENQFVFQSVHALIPSDSGSVFKVRSLSAVFHILMAAAIVWMYQTRVTGRKMCETKPIRRRNRIALHALDEYFP